MTSGVSTTVTTMTASALSWLTIGARALIFTLGGGLMRATIWIAGSKWLGWIKGNTMRLGKKERARANHVKAVVKANVEAIRKGELRLEAKAVRAKDGSLSVIQSRGVSRDHSAYLKGSTHAGYHDNLHAKARGAILSGACKKDVDKGIFTR